MVNAYLAIFENENGERNTQKYLADNIETAEKELKEIAKTENKVLVDLIEIQEAK